MKNAPQAFSSTPPASLCLFLARRTTSAGKFTLSGFTLAHGEARAFGIVPAQCGGRATAGRPRAERDGWDRQPSACTTARATRYPIACITSHHEIRLAFRVGRSPTPYTVSPWTWRGPRRGHNTPPARRAASADQNGRCNSPLVAPTTSQGEWNDKSIRPSPELNDASTCWTPAR